MAATIAIIHAATLFAARPAAHKLARTVVIESERSMMLFNRPLEKKFFPIVCQFLNKLLTLRMIRHIDLRLGR